MASLKDFTIKCKNENLLLPIWFENDHLKLVNQLALPLKEEVFDVRSVEQLGKSIKDMSIRGSGAIGISGAYGIYLAALDSKGDMKEVQRAGELLKSTRPTAVNLMKTVNECLEKIQGNGLDLIESAENAAVEILERQLAFEHQLGQYGAELIKDGDTILTHCHSGALAGSGYGGRALSVIRKAFEQGKDIHVFTCETRPYLQGARITAYELAKFQIPHTLITDGMSGFFMSQGSIQKVVVGSDRVAANGDLANKVGTYMHAIAAKKHNIPFYTATSSHTIDFKTPNGKAIEIEMRNGNEVIQLAGNRIAPEGTHALYPSFDITPNELITGIITEKGVIAPAELDYLNFANLVN